MENANLNESLIFQFTCHQIEVKCVFVQVDKCRLTAMSSTLSLTFTILYSRHHPWVSRLSADLKGDETSFVAFTADLKTVLRFSSSSLCLHSNIVLMVYLTITSTGTVICTVSGLQEGTDCIFCSKICSTCNNSRGAKSELLLVIICVVAGAGYVCDAPSKCCQWLVDQ